MICEEFVEISFKDGCLALGVICQFQALLRFMKYDSIHPERYDFRPEETESRCSTCSGWSRKVAGGKFSAFVSEPSLSPYFLN